MALPVMSQTKPYRELSQDQARQFVERGYVVVPGCVPADTCREWVDHAFARCGYDPQDPKTWAEPRVHTSPSRTVDAARFAPKAFAAICDVLGGEERVDTPCVWGDNFVINLREGADRPWEPPSASIPGWHKDGYFFRHFLDSPEQGLLVITVWTDIKPRGGGTFIAPDSVGVVSRFLAERPEGTAPDAFGALIDGCREFTELTARAGDVVLLHPFMLHAVSQNHLGIPRIICNPPVFLREPMRFDRTDPADHSLVEQAVLRALGRERFTFTPTAPRRADWPEWVRAAQVELRAGGGRTPA